MNKRAEATVVLTVELTRSELDALGRAVVIVTSAADLPFINAADSALKKAREAALRHGKS